MKPKTTVILLLLASLLLTIKGGLLIWQGWQHDLRLKLAKSDLEHFWQRIDRTETPEVVTDNQPEATDSIEMRRMWGEGEQSQKEYRQEIVKLINEQRVAAGIDLEPLTTHTALETSAQQAFESIQKTKRFEHQDLTDLSGQFVKAGEILASENYANPVRTIYDFYLSETHRETMLLEEWRYIGVWSGWVEDLSEEGKRPSDRYVTVVHFGE